METASLWTRFAPSRRSLWADVLVIALIFGVVYQVSLLASRVQAPPQIAVSIDLSISSLPGYAALSLARATISYLLCVIFMLGYGYAAAKAPRAERFLIPLLDILQSIPLLGFMPGIILGLTLLFPNSTIGLELAAILFMFSSQAWNMTFDFYRSLKSVPRELDELSRLQNYGWYRRLTRVEMPVAMLSFVWNSMMSVAGGWFFLMVSEAFVLQDKDFRLPGLGAYMSVAIQNNDGKAMLAAVLTMLILIVLLDILIWRPLVAWAQKFRIEEQAGTEAPTSSMLNLYRRSRLIIAIRENLIDPNAAKLDRWLMNWAEKRQEKTEFAPRIRERLTGFEPLLWISIGFLAAHSVGKVAEIISNLRGEDWGQIALESALTTGRVFLATLLSTLWAVPVGVKIGSNPVWAKRLQPVVQILASFPAPMIFPVAILGFEFVGIPAGLSAALLMMLGAQWYILFNVIAGASVIPAELRELAKSSGFSRWTRWKVLILPAIFPYLVTGWITAAGGSWNATIVTEYFVIKGHDIRTKGLGSAINDAAATGDLYHLSVVVGVMVAIVVLLNRYLWKPLSVLAESKYAMNR